ncbi:MAG: biopolymer transporter ExbD [Kiritimatiellaeota bacterium]|nr:biopolymer transporter ExbD [Kiritimatiellota bacterium]
MRKHSEEYLTGNLTAMIDVVFQLIIFFVCTVNMQDKAIDDSIRLAMAPHGKTVTAKEPGEVNLDVDARGTVYLNRTPYTRAELGALLKKVAQDNYPRPVPVIIRGDAATKHEAIQKAMDACVQAGIWKIKFAAFKERR